MDVICDGFGDKENLVEVNIECPNCGKQKFTISPFYGLGQCQKCMHLFQLNDEDL